MTRTMSLVALAALLFAVAGSHEYLAAKDGKFKKCDGVPPTCDEPGTRFSRQICDCVPRGAEKQLICHLDQDAVDPVTGEIPGEVISVSVESAHIRVLGKHGDCDPGDVPQGEPCTCPAAG